MAIKGSSQKIIITGVLSKKPEMRYTPSGQAVTTFSIPVNRKWKDTNGTQMQEVVWFQITTWGKQAETANTYLNKGSVVEVVGRLKGDEKGHPRIWNRQDGTPGASFEVNAQEVTFLYVETGNGPDEPDFGAPDEDDIPF